MGDAKGANVGIDFFNHEVTSANLKAISSMLGGDITRTWGVPEWLVTHSASYSSTKKALTDMQNARVKYLCPFNWGSKDEYDVAGSPSEKVLAELTAAADREANPLSAASVSATAGFGGGEALVDGVLSGKGFSSSLKAGDYITFTLKASRSFDRVVLYPLQQGGSLPEKVTVQARADGGWKTLGEYTLTGLEADKPAALCFDRISATALKVIVDRPAPGQGFSLAEISAG